MWFAAKGTKGGLNPVFFLLTQKPKNPIPPPARLSNLDARLRNPGINFRPASWFLVFWLSIFGLKYFSRGSPNPKELGFGVFRPIPVPLVPSIWPENACVMPNSKSGVNKYVASKKPLNGFFELNQMVVRTPQVTYPRDPYSSRISTGSMCYF